MSERGSHAPSTPAEPESNSTNLIVDGLVVPRQASPERIEDVSDVLREANERGQAVIPCGGGSQLGLGNIPSGADLALNLSKLNQIAVYEPDDLTISVQAGCRIDALNALLAEHGQMLPFEVADPAAATVGGVYAAGISGPRRFGHGSMRDLVIGITAVSPSGDVAKAGGMVVKNVSGYDMMRLHYGALGSMGVIVQLNFKVLPTPPAQRTVVIRFDDLTRAIEAAIDVRESQLAPTAIVLLDAGGARTAGLPEAPWTLLLRAEGPTDAAAQQTTRLNEATSDGALDQVVLDDEATEQLWRSANTLLAAAPEASSIGIRLGMPASQAAQIASQLLAATAQRQAKRRLSLDLGNGLLFARFDVPSEQLDELRAIWDDARALGTHATLLTAPPSVKRDVEVFGAEPAGFGLMRALKQQFDPSGTLNRGRFIGRL
ncbi:MAG TPA: FAD-binding oxidoreductase [Nitrolancea sp.]|nr:FAD-binding oxidoreductase [Nitrolancea sp.]